MTKSHAKIEMISSIVKYIEKLMRHSHSKNIYIYKFYI
jgi:hypothetical protein